MKETTTILFEAGMGLTLQWRKNIFTTWKPFDVCSIWQSSISVSIGNLVLYHAMLQQCLWLGS